MNVAQLTIRIRNEQDQDMDWMVNPDEVTFWQTLEVVSQVVQSGTVTAFEYKDEEDDHITVRSEDEMKAMIANYFMEMDEEDRTRGLFPPLIIFPKMGKTAQKRNLLGLKIKTHTSTSNTPAPPKPPDLVNTPAQPKPPDLVDHQHLFAQITQDQLEIHESLGSGNGGKVYRSVHLPSGQQIALKVIQVDISPEVQKQILCELDILYKCNSSAIIAFYGAFFVENRISMCTEYMDGGALNRYVPIPEIVLGKMAVHILEGLVYMWNLKLLHRDLKPSNVLVNSKGEVKLCDFGVSTQLVKSIATTFVGTNVYMAPERLQGCHYGIPAEVWSLGVTIFELVTGEVPFNTAKSSMAALMTSIIEQTPSTLSREIFSAELIGFVERCLLKDPALRLTATELTNHKFIQMHADGNPAMIAEWVCRSLQQRQSQLVAS